MSSTASFDQLGQQIPLTTSALRPPAAMELTAYGGPRLLRGKRILDVGTGDGRLALGCAPYAKEVVGIDPDREAIRAARAASRERGIRNASFRVGAAQDLPFPSGRFDLVILSWTL